ncbi:putative membrane protein YhhN [Actinoplanes lutulentus]|uniref:Putative membrane protein YhhN n=2 Tax=Actinoplanes lutulentus TaxID=1287878 RepID=A0A327ZKZ1_9ACTN|nr:lysoplasmalogenase family protein [Actinoplanes lutulentus]RAK43363.1 putative membrane protein YhhN [Actinoplanes lutulentus]
MPAMMRVTAGSTLPLKLFAVVAAVEVAAVTIGVPALQWITRPLLVPLLIWFLIRKRQPDMVVYALGFAAAGEIALLIPNRGGLLTGMVFFLGTLVCLTLAFLNRAKPLPAPSAFFALLAVSGNALFGDQWGALRVPMLVYSLALAAMAAAAAGVSLLIAAGGALFLVSDVLTGLSNDDLDPIAVALHAAALALIVIGWARPQDEQGSERAGVEQPVRRTRAWAGHDAGGRVADDGAVYLSR